MDNWFTDEGSTGELILEQQDEGWYVPTPPTDGNIKCMIEDEALVDENSEKQQIEATVTKFRQGMNGRDSYLFLASADKDTENIGSNSGEIDSDDVEDSESGSHFSSNENWNLKDFRGSGEYVDVEATIDVVFFVKKDTRGMPDMKGELTDDSVLDPVSFIVEEGVNHPYLDEGKQFLFRNVKDHFYKKENEVQVIINSNTDFTEI